MKEKDIPWLVIQEPKTFSSQQPSQLTQCDTLGLWIQARKSDKAWEGEKKTLYGWNSKTIVTAAASEKERISF